MPIVRIELFPGRSAEKKAELAREVTSTLERVAGIPPEATTVIYTEVKPEEWFVAGKAYGTPIGSKP